MKRIMPADDLERELVSLIEKEQQARENLQRQLARSSNNQTTWQSPDDAVGDMRNNRLAYEGYTAYVRALQNERDNLILPQPKGVMDRVDASVLNQADSMGAYGTGPGTGCFHRSDKELSETAAQKFGYPRAMTEQNGASQSLLPNEQLEGAVNTAVPLAKSASGWIQVRDQEVNTLISQVDSALSDKKGIRPNGSITAGAALASLIDSPESDQHAPQPEMGEGNETGPGPRAEAPKPGNAEADSMATRERALALMAYMTAQANAQVAEATGTAPAGVPQSRMPMGPTSGMRAQAKNDVTNKKAVNPGSEQQDEQRVQQDRVALEEEYRRQYEELRMRSEGMEAYSHDLAAQPYTQPTTYTEQGVSR